MRCAEFLCKAQATLNAVHTDNQPCALDLCSHNGTQAYPSEPHDQDRRLLARITCVHHCSTTGLNTTPQWCEQREFIFAEAKLRHIDETTLFHNRHVRKTGLTEKAASELSFGLTSGILGGGEGRSAREIQIHKVLTVAVMRSLARRASATEGK